MEPLLFINWTVDPEIISEPITIRWYGLLFATGFMLGYQVVKRMFNKEGVDEKILDKFLIWTLLATVVGARLGHVFFYEWDYYSQNLAEIPKFWRGGLASHGGAIAIVISTILFSRFVSKKSSFWMFDKMVVAVALAACFIRLGNLFNHEIVGHPTDVSWGFIFAELNDKDAMGNAIARHPTQLYEAISYLALFAFLFWMYWKTNARKFQGRLLGWFLIIQFGVRFLLEFTKVNQTDLVDGWAINMGQILSIPAVLAGVFLLVRSYRIAPVEYGPDEPAGPDEPKPEENTDTN